jgi:DNA-directed RNA polymerase specialized sigma24 family protein
VAVEALQAAFLELLPQFQAHAEFAFRFVRCEQARADCVAETVALAWKGFLALARRDKDPGAFVTTFARRCAQAVRAGRRLAGQESGRDVLAPAARYGHGFAVGRLPDYTTPYGAWQESLMDNTRSPVDEAAAFRLDFPCWLATLAERDRRLVEDMTLGHRTVDLARQFGLSAGRVSQLRRHYHAAWRRFHGELDSESDRPALAVT